MNQEILSAVKTAIIKVDENVRLKDIREDSSLRDDLGFDSLDVVSLIMEVEHKYDITIADDESENIATVSNLVTTVERHLERGSEVKEAQR